MAESAAKANPPEPVGTVYVLLAAVLVSAAFVALCAHAAHSVLRAGPVAPIATSNPGSQ